MSDGDIRRPTDDDGYTARILTEPPKNRNRFSEWAEASGFVGDVWELVGPDGEVQERYLHTDTDRLGDTEIVPREELEQTGDIEGVPVYACPRCDYQWITEDCDCPECGWAGMCQEGWA